MFGSGSSVIAKVLWALGAQAGSGSAAAGPDARPTTATTVLLESSALAMMLFKTFMSASFRQPTPRAHRGKCLYLPQGGQQSSTSLNASVNFHSLFRGRGRVRYRLMSAPSPVPDSGVASDGKWSPQRWETTFISVTNESLQVVIDEANRHTNTHGAEGWEVVNSSVQRVQVSHHFAGYDKGGEFYFEWSIVCTMKRPLPPA
jgi:hypothetical protein